MSDSGWTVDTLAAYMDAQLAGLRQLLDERQAAQLRGEERWDASLERRFTSVNGFRAELAEQQRTFLPRSEYDAEHKNTSDRIALVGDVAGAAISRDEANAAVARLHERIDEHQQRLDVREGRGSGLNAGWIYLVGFIAAMGILVSLVNAFRI